MNPYRDEVALVLGAQRFVLRPTFEALAEMEGVLGLGLLEMCGQLSRGKITLRQLVALVAAGIKGGGGVVPDNLGQLILTQGSVAVLGVVGPWLSAALSGEAGDDEDDAPGKA